MSNLMIERNKEAVLKFLVPQSTFYKTAKPWVILVVALALHISFDIEHISILFRQMHDMV